MQKIARPSKEISLLSVKIAVVGIFLLFIAGFFYVFPDMYNRGVDYIQRSTGFSLPRSQQKSPFVLGLDLRGGAHLVYEADVSQIQVQDQKDAVEGVRDVIERRINALGVSEPIIQTNKSGEHWRVIVELAGVTDIQDAVNAIGETPVLEFKELSKEPPRALTPAELDELKKINEQELSKANELLKKITEGGEKFEDIASAQSQDVNSRDNGGLLGYVRGEGIFASMVKAVQGKADNYIHNAVVENEEGFNVVKLNATDTQGEEFGVAHLLFCYGESVQGCDFYRSKEDARAVAEEAYNALVTEGKQPSVKNLDEYANTHADAIIQPKGSDLGYFSRGQLAPSVETAVIAAQKNVLSSPVETEYGYHLILKYDTRPFTQYSLSRILITKTSKNDMLPQDERWIQTGLSGKQLERADLTFDQNGIPEVQIQFNKEGQELFALITERNIGSLVAIFLDGQPISIPQVAQAIYQGTAVIHGNFTVQTAKQLAQRLNAGALPVPISLVGQSTVGATLGEETLGKSIKAGVIGLLLVVLFMILYYRLPGLIASVSLMLYTLLVLAVFKILPVTLTAAAIAGLVLSIGMAIDANILIFERMKEELQSGKSLINAMEEGFTRAWFSIRASNMSSTITAIILIYLSTSVVKGFAITLIIGIAMSIFTAVTITRYLMRFIVRYTKPTPWLYLGINRKK